MDTFEKNVFNHQRALTRDTTGQLVVPHTRTVYGSRSFAVHGPEVWNSLPAELRSPDMTRGVLRTQLKTHLFNCQSRIC